MDHLHHNQNHISSATHISTPLQMNIAVSYELL